MSAPLDEATATPKCGQHPALRAAYVCSDCGQPWCSACVKHVKLEGAQPVAICPQCHGLCARAGVIRTHPPETFLGGLISALAFPLRGASLIILIAGTLLNVLAIRLGRSMLFNGLFMLLGFAGGAFMVNFLRSLLLSSAEGKETTAPWADFQPQAWTEAALQFLGV